MGLRPCTSKEPPSDPSLQVLGPQRKALGFSEDLGEADRMERGPSFQLEVPRAQGRAVRPPRDEALRALRGRQGGSCGGLAARSNGSRCWSATARPPAPCPTSSWATHTPSGSSRKTCVDSAPRPPSPRSSRTSRRQVGVGPGRAPSTPARRVLAPRAPPRPPLPDRHVGADPSDGSCLGRPCVYPEDAVWPLTARQSPRLRDGVPREPACRAVRTGSGRWARAL